VETVPEIGGGDWKGPLADSSKVVGRHYTVSFSRFRNFNFTLLLLARYVPNVAKRSI